MEEYEKKENEEILMELTITKESVECFVGGVLTTLLIVLLIWAFESYSHIN